MIYLWVVLLSCLAGLWYRWGGTGGVWWKKSWVRDYLCPAVGFATLMIIGVKAPWWVHLASYGLMVAALTTYMDGIFGYDNYWAHGALVGLAYLPYAIWAGAWLPFGIRVVVCCVGVGLWSELTKWDDLEESGRGFIINISNLLFLIR